MNFSIEWRNQQNNARVNFAFSSALLGQFIPPGGGQYQSSPARKIFTVGENYTAPSTKLQN